MLTVVGKPDLVLQALNYGARSYMTKPFDKKKRHQCDRPGDEGGYGSHRYIAGFPICAFSAVFLNIAKIKMAGI